MPEIDAGDPCGQCQHPFALHAMVSPGGNPMQGGIVLCPVAGCPCYATWGIGDDRPTAVPQDEIDRLRTAVQTGEM